MSNSGKMQDRLGTSPGGMYGNRFYGATERDLGNAMGMVAAGPGRMPPEGVQSMASRFISETGGNSPRAIAAKPGGPKPARGGPASTLASTGYSDLEAAFDALEGRRDGVRLATMQPGSAMGGTAGGAVQDFTDLGVQRAADARMLAAGNIYADPVATASIAPTAAQAAVTEALAYAAPQKPRMKMTIPGLMASNAGSMAGGGRSGNAGQAQSRGSAWGASGSRPTGGGAGGERTGARSFYGR